MSLPVLVLLLPSCPLTETSLTPDQVTSMTGLNSHSESLGLSTQSLLEQFSRRTIATYNLLPRSSDGTAEVRNHSLDLRGNSAVGQVSHLARSFLSFIVRSE